MKREVPPHPQHLSTEAAGSSPARWHLDRIVAELRISREETHSIRRDGEARRAPSRDVLEAILNGLTEALFPRHYGQSDLDGENIDYFVGNTLSIALDSLCDQIHRGALFVGDELLPGFRREEAVELTRSFAAQLPAVRGLLISDLRAAFVGDPAARNFPEILIGYPGMTAIIHHRLAHILHRQDARLVARLMAEIAHARTGIDIHPGATIGSGFFIDHGTGVVIGETADHRRKRPHLSGRHARRAAFPKRRRRQSDQGRCPPPDRRGRRRHLRRRHHPRPHHDRSRLDDRRQCLAYKGCAAEQRGDAGDGWNEVGIAAVSRWIRRYAVL